MSAMTRPSEQEFQAALYVASRGALRVTNESATQEFVIDHEATRAARAAWDAFAPLLARERAAAERERTDAAARVVAAVEALHRLDPLTHWCVDCVRAWPCPTVRAARSAGGAA